MLMDTGIGTTSYCFIAQGQIARLLEANPKERRAVFEEAAGVSRYRKRKDKAVARLERVRRDLETLATVREDVDKRYRTLKSQAATARRYKRYQDALTEKRARLALIDYRELLERKAELDVEIAELREREAEAAARAAEADRRVKDSETEDSDLDRSASEAEDLRSRAEVEAERLETEIRNATEVARSAEGEIEPLKAEIAELDSQVDEATKELARLGETKREIESDRASAHEILDGLKGAAREAAESTHKLSAESKAQGDEAFRAAQSLAEVRNRLVAAQSEQKSVTARAEKLGGRLARINESFETARAKAEEAKVDCVRLSDGLATMAREASEEKARLGELDAESSALADEIADRRAEFESLKTRLMLLEDLHRRGDGVPAGTRELVKASRDPDSKLGEVYGVVGNLLWAAPKVRTAIETALGGRASDLLVDSVATAKRAIDHLRELDLGRASFLPLDTMLPTLLIAEEFLAEEGALGRASDLVKYDGRFGLAVEYLLGRVLIVRDRKTASRMVPLTGAGTRIVTLDGEIVDGCGPVRGGANAAAHLGLLGRKAEINRLRGTVGELDGTLERMVAKRAATDGEVAQLRESVRKRAAEIRRIERAVAKAGTEKDSLTKEAKRLEAERLSAAAELDEATRDRDALAGEIQNLSARLESLEAAEREAKAKVDELTARIEEAEAESARREKDFIDRRTSFAGLEEKAKGIARHFEQLERELTRTRDALRARREDLDRADARATEHRGAAESMQERMTAKREELDKLAASAACARARRDELRDARDSVRAAAHEAKAEHQEAQTALTELRLAEREVSLKVDGLEESTKNELGISLAGLAAEPEAPAEEISPEGALPGGAEAAEADEGSGSGDANPDAPQSEVPQPLADAGDPDASAENANASDGAEALGEGQAAADAETASDEAEVPAGPVDPDVLRSEIKELRRKIDRMGRVNLFALEELEEFTEKREFYRAQHEDLAKARTSLNDVINRINKRTKALFQETFDTVRGHFQELFRKLFHGGKADIFLDIGEDEDILDAGIEIVAKPPGREALKLSLLSGGQRALTTIALLFAIFRAKPSPFCVLDEVDAPLDDANVERFCLMLEEHCATTQFIVVTHHKATMGFAKKLYGITMQEQGVSLKLPVKLEDIGTTIKVDAPKGAVAAQEGPFAQVNRAA
jgi:chromosome segregation protein